MYKEKCFFIKLLFMQNIRFNVIVLMIFGACITMTHSCSTCGRQQSVQEITIDLADLAIDTTYVDMARKVYYALPTPIELSMMMKSLGISFQSDLLNDPANASRYLTNQKRALNFGAYVTDLSYAGLFEQSQTVLRYKLAIRTLAEEWGLGAAIDVNAVRQLEENINDKDAVLRIVSETYASCTAALNENDRYFLTLAVFVGGWVEAMHIATNKTTLHDNRTKQLLIDQKLTFDMLWMAMTELKNIPEVAGMMNEMSELAQLLDKIDVENVDSEEFAKIKEQIRILRQNFIQI